MTEWIETGEPFNANGGCDRWGSLLFSFSDIESLGFVNLNCQILHEYLVCIVWCGDIYF